MVQDNSCNALENWSICHFLLSIPFNFLFLNQGFSNKKYKVLIQESTVHLDQTMEESEQT